MRDSSRLGWVSPSWSLVLLADKTEIRRRAADVLTQAAAHPGHIFNLGHGVLPQTPVENAIALVEAVKELSAR